MKLHIKSIMKRTLSITLVLVLVALVFTSCGTPKDARSIKLSSVSETNAEFTNTEVHTATVMNDENFSFVCKSGLLEMYFDNSTYSIVLRNSSTNKLWYCLPAATDGDEGNKAAVVSVTLSNGGNTYYLNSQDNSVAFNSASFKAVENGVQITYDMAFDEENALKGANSVSVGTPYISLTVEFTLKDGVLHSIIKCDSIVLSDGFILENIELMNYFGSAINTQSGDFILVPDANGALVLTNSAEADEYTVKNFKVYDTAPVYSQDGQSIESADAIFAVYGMKTGSDAFVGIILDGDGIATISSHRKSGNELYNRVGASFNITDISYDNKDSGKDITKYIGSTYKGNIDICYRFLSGKNASYTGLASACREVMIRQGILSTEMLPDSTHIPFMLTVQGAVNKNSKHSYKKLSTYEQTFELLQQLKAKGVNNLTLRYSGMLDGADMQDRVSEAKPLKALGSKRDFEELQQYVQTQKFTMYLDTSVLLFNKNSGSLKKYAAQNVRGEYQNFEYSNPYSKFAGNDTRLMYAGSLSNLGDNLISLLNNTNGYGFDGYCINDASKFVYADYDGDSSTRVSATKQVSSQLKVISNNHKLMVTKGNFYSLSRAKAIIDMKRETSYPETDCYIQIPFVELMLHGLLNYSFSAVNTNSDTKVALLKNIEYGAVPNYKWFCTSVDSETDASYYYLNNTAAAVDEYMLADAVLGDLANARLTNHYKVQDGVYCTEYDDSILVYVNYNTEPVVVNSITIGAQNCMRIN